MQLFEQTRTLSPLPADTPNTSTYCDCGERKRETAAACKRCTYLDGHMAAGLVISALRGTSGLSLAELCHEVYGAHTHSSGTAMHHVLQRLLRKRRVRRYLREADVGESASFTGRHCNGGHWVYVLSGDWRRA